ncbi:hypothetical protein M8J75_005025 [Diaphorina citri]|nr:hypothetical protein M8J75_005025 [Diaphorina citri]
MFRLGSARLLKDFLATELGWSQHQLSLGAPGIRHFVFYREVYAPQVSIRNDAIISTFLPSFGSPTATTAVSPLTDVSCSSPQPQPADVSCSSPQPQTADGASTSMAEAIVHPPPISLLEDNPDTAGPATETTISPGLDLPNSNLTVDSSSNQITLPEVTDDISSEIDIDMPVKYPYQENYLGGGGGGEKVEEEKEEGERKEEEGEKEVEEEKEGEEEKEKEELEKKHKEKTEKEEKKAEEQD